MAAERWYWVDYTSRLDEVRATLPVADGEPRYSTSGLKFVVRLTAEVDGALTHAEAVSRMASPAWSTLEES